MKYYIYIYRISFIMSFGFLVLLGCKKEEAGGDAHEEDEDELEIVIPSPFVSLGADELVSAIEENVPFVKEVTMEAHTSLHANVDKLRIDFVNQSDQPYAMFVLRIDLSDPSIGLQVGMPNGGTTFGFQTTTNIAVNEDRPGARVIAAVNADYFGAGGVPYGPCFKGGMELKESFDNISNGFFAMLKPSGAFGYQYATPIAGAKTDFYVLNNNTIKEAVGAREILVKNSVLVNSADPDRHPRTFVGYDRNNVVYLVVVDGRQPDYSIGMTATEMAQVMKAFGTYNAVNLDGGGSTTLVVRDSDAVNGFSVVNSYSDPAERTVANTLNVVNYAAE